MIRINVFIEVSAPNRAKMIEVAQKLVAASVKDEGCKAYDLYESSTRADVLMICETWSNREALVAHCKKPHFTTLLPVMEALGTVTVEEFEY